MSNTFFVQVLQKNIIYLHNWRAYATQHPNDLYGEVQVSFYERSIAGLKKTMSHEDILTAYANAEKNMGDTE